MKLAARSAAKSPAAFAAAASLRPVLSRYYATHTGPGKTASPGPKRRSVTPFNDDGHVPWSDLQRRERVGRAAQQGFNVGLIVTGIVLTGSVVYLLFTEVFSPDSKVANFSRTVDIVKKDPECQRLLGNPKKITAHGEETYNKWRRARPIASTITRDRYGVDHLMMKFYVEGPLNRGQVQVHMTRHPRHGDGDFEYKYLFIDIRGHHRIYLRNADEEKKAADAAGKKKSRFLGINWG